MVLVHVFLMMSGVDVFIYSNIDCNVIGRGLIDHDK